MTMRLRTELGKIIRRIRGRIRPDHGGTTLWIILMLPTLVGFAGLAYDGGNLFTARREAHNNAAAAARAGANALDRGSLYLEGPARLSGESITLTKEVIDAQGAVPVTVGIHDGHMLVVTVKREVQPTFLGILNLGPWEVEGTARVRVRSALKEDDWGTCGLTADC